MLAIVIGLLLIVTIAAGIVAMVAFPRLREGEELLTPGSKQSIQRAGQQARQQSAAAAGHTVKSVGSLRSRSAAAWAPLSQFLHRQFDRLESRAPSAPPAAGHHVSGATGGQRGQDTQPRPDSRLLGRPGDQIEDRIDDQADDRIDDQAADQAADPAQAAASVGRPRPVPPISGPIPELDESPESPRRAERHPSPEGVAVINLRDAEASPDVTTRRR